jgi:hypothetical protein
MHDKGDESNATNNLFLHKKQMSLGKKFKVAARRVMELPK